MALTAQMLIAAIAAFLAVLGLSIPQLAIWDAVIILIIVYFIVLISSILMLKFSFFVLGTKDESVNWKNLLVVVLFRDVISIALAFVPLFIGQVIAFSIWVGVLKYRFNIEWGKSVLVALIAALLPAAIAAIALMGLVALSVSL